MADYPVPPPEAAFPAQHDYNNADDHDYFLPPPPLPPGRASMESDYHEYQYIDETSTQDFMPPPPEELLFDHSEVTVRRTSRIESFPAPPRESYLNQYIADQRNSFRPLLQSGSSGGDGTDRRSHASVHSRNSQHNLAAPSVGSVHSQSGSPGGSNCGNEGSPSSQRSQRSLHIGNTGPDSSSYLKLNQQILPKSEPSINTRPGRLMIVNLFID